MNNRDIILAAEDVKKSFRSPGGEVIEVLRGAGLSVLRGESLSLRGESGAGKSTFLNIIAGLESADSGTVSWDGARIDKLSNGRQAKLRGDFMGFVFQNYCLVPELTALQNVELALRIAGRLDKDSSEYAKDLLKTVGLEKRAKHLPSQMSGGEKQRVAIARAIVNRPRIILADEPTGNLDEETGKHVMNMFLDLCAQKNTALLLITHNPDFARKTSRRLVLKHGLVVEE